MKRLHTLALALVAAFLPPLAAPAQPNGMGMMDAGHHGFFGRIASVNGSSFTLEDGRTVFLKQGTVINPTGRRLHAGQRVVVHGYPAGNGSINARVVNIVPRRGY
jgi:hypothetical protein